jgi:glycine/D-amino acid oxidase-like deaminating enzyme
MTSLWMQTAPPIPRDDAPPPSEAVLVIVGAGLTGLSLARMLRDAGVSALVLEARSIGALTTGNTTGKLSLLQGDVFSEVQAHTGDAVVRAYADGNRAGQEWLRTAVEGVPGCAVRKDAVTWAETEEGVAVLDREAAAMAAAGIDVERLAGHDLGAMNLPFEPAAALRLRDQTQLQPMRVLAALAGAVRSGGSRIVEGCRVTGVDVADNGVVLETSRGRALAA